MSVQTQIPYTDNPEFNQWLDDSYDVIIEEFTFPPSEVLYAMNYSQYEEALNRYNVEPTIVLSRIINKFPSPIAYYLDQAQNNHQNSHHRLDLLKSCWESLIFFIYGLVVAEANHRNFPLKELGAKYAKYWSDKVFDKLNLVEAIIDKALSSGLTLHCSTIIPLSVISDIRKLNQERNGFEHAAAKTEQQQEELYDLLHPSLVKILGSLIHLEKVKLVRYHSAEILMTPRCEVFTGSTLDGKKECIIIGRDNFIKIMDYWNKNLIFAKIDDIVFSIAPFIHFYQEPHETNAFIAFYKKDKAGKYQFEVMSKSQTKEINKSDFTIIENQLRSNII
jgi:hypothetical protein